MFNVFIIFAALVFIYLLARPMVKGAIYFPTWRESVKDIVRLSDIKQGQRVVDLGSGDGRILVAFAEQGFQADGYEINPLLVLYTLWRLRYKKLNGKARVYWESYWKINLSEYDVVVVFGFPSIMKQLKEKIYKELPPGTRVVSNIYEFPGWQYTKQENGVYLYIV